MKDFIKQASIKFISMFQDGDFSSPMSIGRFGFMIMLLCSCFFWIHFKIDPPAGMLKTLWLLLAYVTATKGYDLGAQFLEVLKAKNTHPTP